MIFIDSNVPMYLIGAEHPNKAATVRTLETVTRRGERLVTDVEVLQEILHRYTAIRRSEAVQLAFDTVLGLVSETFPIQLDDVQVAKGVVCGSYGLSARDALHIAVMQRHGIDTIMSFDRGFDRYPGISRLA
jgi:predicted nucleic acid-binding protein